MKIMQRGCLKFMGLIIILNLGTSLSVDAQTYRLKMADSLFQAKRYTQSLEHYEEILRQRYYTPAMFLKMAYVHEGLNQMGSAMYYLNLYYLATKDESVLAKIDEMAEKYNLEGYHRTDFDRIWSFYLDNYLWVTIGLAATMLFFLALMYHIRVHRRKRPIGSGIDVVILSLLLFAHLYYGTSNTPAIIASSTTYLMDGPSAGASVIDVVSDGHRVKIIDQQDVWLKIKWEDEEAYVKESAVKRIVL